VVTYPKCTDNQLAILDWDGSILGSLFAVANVTLIKNGSRFRLV